MLCVLNNIKNYIVSIIIMKRTISHTKRGLTITRPTSREQVEQPTTTTVNIEELTITDKIIKSNDKIVELYDNDVRHPSLKSPKLNKLNKLPSINESDAKLLPRSKSLIVSPTTDIVQRHQMTRLKSLPVKESVEKKQGRDFDDILPTTPVLTKLSSKEDVVSPTKRKPLTKLKPLSSKEDVISPTNPVLTKLPSKEDIISPRKPLTKLSPIKSPSKEDVVSPTRKPLMKLTPLSPKEDVKSPTKPLLTKLSSKEDVKSPIKKKNDIEYDVNESWTSDMSEHDDVTNTDTRPNKEYDNNQSNENKEDDVDMTETKGLKVVVSFEHMDLSMNVLRGVYANGFDKPSSIQQKTIPAIMTGRDVIAQAPSGFGKTGAFGIGMLQRLDEMSRDVQAIVISPTQPLAEQTYNNITALSRFTKLKTILCIGGTDIKKFKSELRTGRQIIIGTPGRIIHMIEDRSIYIDKLKVLILDEADQLLDTEFIKQMYDIITKMNTTTQIILVSATMSQEVVKLTKQFMKQDLIKILVKKEELTLKGIKQYYVVHTKESEKFSTLLEIYKRLSVSQTIIYANNISTVEQLKSELSHYGFTADVIHKNCENKRETLEKFRKGSVRIIISTSLLARGIDIQQVSMVVNYDLPIEHSQYLHRIGRSGRFGRKGVAINLITESQWTDIESIQKEYAVVMEEMPEDFDKHVSV